MTHPDELSRLREEAARILKDVRAGTHPQDIRDAGKALNGKWDQDFPTALLQAVVDNGETIKSLTGELAAEKAGRKDVERDARRYRRLQILGCAVMNTPQLDKGLVSRFSNLDKIMDDDLKSYPSRGEYRAALTKGEG